MQDDIQATPNLTINVGLRYQYGSAPSESSGRIANFDFGTGMLDAPGTSIMDAPKLNFAPRFGIAYTPFGSRKTVFRAGFGIFHSSLNPALAQELTLNLPEISQAASVTRAQDPSLIGFPTPDISAVPGSKSLTAVDKTLKSAYVEAWHFNVQQGFGQDTLLQVGYVGSRTLHVNAWTDRNSIIYPTGLRPYAGFSIINYYDPSFIASYNALQVSLKRRLSRGLTFNVNYTYAHTLDMGGSVQSFQVQNPNNIRDEYGDGLDDMRHYLQFDYTYQIPAAPGLPKWLGSGWQLNGITVIRGGFSVNVICGCDSGGTGLATARPNLVPGQSVRPTTYLVPTSQINRAAFSRPPDGTFGNVGRALLDGPGSINWDFSLFKKFDVREGQRIEFRAETFNMFNTPNFDNPIANYANAATFGRTFSAAAARQIQFGLKYVF